MCKCENHVCIYIYIFTNIFSSWLYDNGHAHIFYLLFCMHIQVDICMCKYVNHIYIYIVQIIYIYIYISIWSETAMSPGT